MRWRLPIFLLASVLAAQEALTPRKVPEDFPVHQDKGRLALGAEFMVHSFGRDAERYVAEDYLTIEVGIYPVNKQNLLVTHSEFKLRINGKKEVIPAASAGTVAMSLNYKDWDQDSRMDSQDGRQQTNSPFPGGNRAPQDRVPRPAPDLGSLPPGPTHIAPSDLLRQVALQEKESKFPSGGYLYFPYRGKMKSIKTLELIFDNGSESITLSLR